MEENTINQKAWELLEEAKMTSSLVKKKERASGVVKEDHMYPSTKQETDRMADLLQQAKAAADDPNEASFSEKYNLLNEIVEWSYARYRTWQWSIVAGVVLLALLLLWGRSSNKENVEAAKANLATVEAWTPCDTTLTWEECDSVGIPYQEEFTTANKYKAYQLGELKSRYLHHTESAANLKAQADTITNKDSKESRLKSSKNHLERAEKNRAEFDELASMKFEQVQKVAKKDAKERISDSKGSYLFFIIFCLVLIALYIWTGYAYGYDITRSRIRDKILTWIRNIGFTLAGFFFGGGLAMQLFAPDYIVKTTYANGTTSTHREGDIGGTAMNAMFKFIMMAIGVFIFIGVSLFIMLVETIGGVKHKIRDLKGDKLEPVAAPAEA